MLIRLNNTQWLTRDFTTPEEQKSAARDVELNGKRLVQIAEPLGAESAILFNRGNEKLTLDFTVTEQHATPALAYSELLQALQNAAEGPADLFLGDPAEGWLHLHFSYAVVEALRNSTIHGLTSHCRYRLLTGRIAQATLLPPTGSQGYPYAFPATVDGGAMLAAPSRNPESGTVDGGTFSDALAPATLTLDAGSLP